MKNHWIKQSNGWHEYSITFDAGKSETKFYVDGVMTDIRIYTQKLSDEIIKEICTQEDVRFMECVESAYSEITVDPPLEHHIDIVGI